MTTVVPYTMKRDYLDVVNDNSNVESLIDQNDTIVATLEIYQQYKLVSIIVPLSSTKQAKHRYLTLGTTLPYPSVEFADPMERTD
jgi:hypothetical protein